jgi:hypothetical protein
MLPRLQVIAIGATNVGVRLQALNCYSKLMTVLDKESVIASVLPTMEKVKDVDKSPQVLVRH